MGRRLFVSVDVSDRADEIAALQDELPDADGLDWTDPTQAHVTLLFLGDVDGDGSQGGGNAGTGGEDAGASGEDDADDRVDAIGTALSDAVDDADQGPFEAHLGGLGVFPSLEYISVLWLGVTDGERALESLHEAVATHLAPLGFEPDHDEFTPHVTLARMRHAGPKSAVQRAVRERDPDVGELDVDAIHLTESHLSDDGPRYETVRRFPLE